MGGHKIKRDQNFYCIASELASRFAISRARGIFPYMGQLAMCGAKGYDFSAALVINRASIFADFGHFGPK